MSQDESGEIESTSQPLNLDQLMKLLPAAKGHELQKLIVVSMSSPRKCYGVEFTIRQLSPNQIRKVENMATDKQRRKRSVEQEIATEGGELQ